MDKILNYKCTKHFEERIKERGLEKFLISLCLTKGKEQKEKTLVYINERKNN